MDNKQMIMIAIAIIIIAVYWKKIRERKPQKASEQESGVLDQQIVNTQKSAPNLNLSEVTVLLPRLSS